MLEDLGGGDSYEWTVASKAWADEWATNRQFPFINMSDALKKTYPAFAANPPTPWPATDGQIAMPDSVSQFRLYLGYFSSCLEQRIDDGSQACCYSFWHSTWLLESWLCVRQAHTFEVNSSSCSNVGRISKM
jgi:hypothetical protein